MTEFTLKVWGEQSGFYYIIKRGLHEVCRCDPTTLDAAWARGERLLGALERLAMRGTI